ncbi:MAG: hypothetical protein N2258_05140, partial [Brevinematales bacterium]|nr:hypothetical protein [Brevinematales bacterium]
VVLCIIVLTTTVLSCGKETKVSTNIKKPSFPEVVKSVDSEEVNIYADVEFTTAVVKPYSIRGMNFNNSMQLAKVVDKANALKIPTITYPAGNIGDTQDMNREMDFSFLSLQLSMFEKQPFIFVQTRVFGGTVEGAIQSVKNAEKVGIKVDVWSIGNEPDLYHRAHAPEWTPEYYAKVFREQTTALKAYKKDIKVAGPMVSQPKDEWIKVFIKECGDLVDVLAWHWYPTSGDATDEMALATAPDIKEQIQRYRSWLKDPNMNPKGYKRDIKLALTEYAIHWNTPNKRHLGDMVGAMWLAEVLGYLAMEEIDFSHYFCFGEYGGHSLFEPGNYKPRPSYWVFNFYANYFGTNIIASLSSDEKVKVVSSKDENKIYLMVINQSKEKTKKLTLNILNNKNKLTKVIKNSLTGEIKGPVVKSTTNDYTEGFKLTLEPYSVTSIVLE